MYISKVQSKDFNEIKKLLSIIVKMQGDSSRWIDKEKADFILEYYEDDLEYCKKIGLIIEIDGDGRKYIKITGEGWYILTNKMPQEWQPENNIVTSDFEVIIPFNSNPYSLLKLINYSKLKNIYNNEDYLLIFDISPSTFNAEKYTITYDKFIKELNKITNYIPDIIKTGYCI